MKKNQRKNRKLKKEKKKRNKVYYCLAGVILGRQGMLRVTLPKVSFSPESGGRVNPRRAMLDISTHGTIRLKK